MAIQFNCPYCTASIRVPDSAAGKRGSCPKCGTKLIVPKVGPPAEESKPVAKRESAPAGLPEIPTDSPVLSEGASVVSVARRRAKRKGTNPLIPIALFSVVLGVLAYWMGKSEQLEGELVAERITEFTIPPGLIDKSSFGLPAEEIDPTWEDLKQHPPAGVLIPDRFQMQFLPEANGLQIFVRETSATEVFRVQTRRAPAIRHSIKQHAEEILKLQRTEFREAMKRFLQDWETSREKDLPFKTESYYKSVGFNRLTGPLGYSLVAEIGPQSYRCVHEDANGDLYFLLPRKTKSFVLTGRELPNGKTIFPGRFTVQVSNPSSQETKASPEPDAPPESLRR